MESKRNDGPIVYTIGKRTPEEWEAPGEVCYDLTVEGAGGICVLRDVARSESSANRLLAFFKRCAVRPEEAEYVMEDLLVDLTLPD